MEFHAKTFRGSKIDEPLGEFRAELSRGLEETADKLIGERWVIFRPDGTLTTALGTSEKAAWEDYIDPFEEYNPAYRDEKISWIRADGYRAQKVRLVAVKY